MATVIDRTGQQQEFTPTLEMYRDAYAQGLTLPQYLERQVSVDQSYGTAFEQVLASEGLFLRRDKTTGLRPPTMHQVLDGGMDRSMGVTRPDGSQALTVAGRLLFPAVLMQLIESQLMDDWSSYEGVYNRMVAVTDPVSSPRADQPIINLTAPRTSLAQPIAQGAEPISMVGISLSDKSYRIPTFSIGFEITDEAAKSSAVDLVGIALREQAIGQRIALINTSLSQMINGDPDLGMTALTAENASTYDAAITAGVMTNKGWVKWLRKDWTKLTIDWVICDIDTYLAIEQRTNRPTIFTDTGNDMRLTSMPQAANPGIPGSVNFFIVDNSLIGTNTLVGIDSRKAIRKVVYTEGSYSAVENFVLRKTSAMRFDFAEASFRMFYNGDGWKKLVLA